ncbi:MAG: hypothetical protein IT270_15855 [Saprospiraceae bacterium]|nr:hypothetical protein [Saprospiraceae bacterium]
MRLLNQDELETLHLFVATPLFNDMRPKDTRELFEYIKIYYPEFKAQELHRETVAKHFFPDHRNPDSELQRTMAQLLNIVRQFIAFMYVNNTRNNSKTRTNQAQYELSLVSNLNQVRQQLALLRFYSQRLLLEKNNEVAEDVNPGKRKERKAENIFQNLYNELKKTLYESDDFSKDNEYTFNDRFYFRFLLEQEKAFLSLNDKRSDRIYILEAIEELDRYYLITKLDYMCKLIYFQSMVDLYDKQSEEFHRFTINKVVTRDMVKAIHANNYLQSPMVSLYCHLLDLLLEDNPDEAYLKFNDFMPLFLEQEKKLPSSQKTGIHAILRGFWLSRYRETKDKRFLERLHSLQLDHMKQYVDMQGLPGSFFQNIILGSIKLGKLDLANHIFQTYHDKLTGEQQVNWIVSVCRSSILLQENRPKDAADNLNHYFNYGEITDIYLYCVAATLDVRIRYALNDLDSDESERLIHTASTRIRRDSLLPENRKKERLRFFTLAKSLYRIKERRNMDKRADLTKDLAAWKNKLDEGPVVDWEWLEEKFAELSA